MKRIIMICEGQTEQAFSDAVLRPHFFEKNILLQCPLIKQSHGGIVKWVRLKKEIETYLKSEPGAYITTFLDYYGLQSKHEFPLWEDVNTTANKSQRMQRLEDAMLHDVDSSIRHRFVPYLQLHEFEGLLFNNVDVFDAKIPPAQFVGRSELVKALIDHPDPELINDTRENCPSNRLKRIINGYDKVLLGNILAEAIGLSRIRAKSPRFNNWITRLESI